VANPSFYFAIFKRLQGCDGGMADGSSHFDVGNLPELSGGFSLTDPHHLHGMFGTVTHVVGGSLPPILDGKAVLTATAADSPLYVVLHACMLGQKPFVSNPASFSDWPVMPNYGSVASNTVWNESNSGGNDLVGALKTWIDGGKPDDTPKPNALLRTTLTQLQASMARFPGIADFDKPPFVQIPVLFVCSKSGDDGRRTGDLGVPAANSAPANYWATSPIYLLDPATGLQHQGDLKATETYNVAAVIGNCGNWPAGRLAQGGTNITVRCDAEVFNSGFGPSFPLPSLSNLDPTGTAPVFEQWGLPPKSYDLVGFRFEVDSVFAGLAKALAKAVTDNSFNLGGFATPEAWLKGGHPCVKVYITGGETKSNLTIHPKWNDVPVPDTPIATNRHIAQHNLAPFAADVHADKKPKPKWKNFIAPQVGRGVTNRLVLEHALRVTDAQFYLAMPKATFEHYVRKGGAIRNLAEVHDVTDKPFPDAVILRETARGGEIVLAAHDKELYLGLSLGIAVAAERPAPLGEASIIHHAHDGTIAGGFTLNVVAG